MYFKYSYVKCILNLNNLKLKILQLHRFSIFKNATITFKVNECTARLDEHCDIKNFHYFTRKMMSSLFQID